MYYFTFFGKCCKIEKYINILHHFLKKYKVKYPKNNKGKVILWAFSKISSKKLLN